VWKHDAVLVNDAKTVREASKFGEQGCVMKKEKQTPIRDHSSSLEFEVCEITYGVTLEANT
jgi:hypothetical protein